MSRYAFVFVGVAGLSIVSICCHFSRAKESLANPYANYDVAVEVYAAQYGQVVADGRYVIVASGSCADQSRLIQVEVTNTWLSIDQYKCVQLNEKAGLKIIYACVDCKDRGSKLTTSDRAALNEVLLCELSPPVSGSILPIWLVKVDDIEIDVYNFTDSLQVYSSASQLDSSLNAFGEK